MAQQQPVDVLMLGSLMKALDDPDFAIMVEYAIGVPIGLGVNLPRTPEVFPAKVKWSLAGQTYWGGDSEKARGFTGKTRDHYPSAKGVCGGD